MASGGAAAPIRRMSSSDSSRPAAATFSSRYSPLGAGNRDDVRALVLDPCQRELPRGHAFLLGQSPQRAHDFQVVIEVVLGEPGQATTHVTVGELAHGRDGAGEETPPQR